MITQDLGEKSGHAATLKRFGPSALLCAALWIGDVAVNTAPAGDEIHAGMLFSHPAYVQDGARSIALEAGELFVPESRARPTGKLISIPFLRLRSTAQTPGAPIFLLSGGPGVSGIDELEQDAQSRAMTLFYRELGDVVIFDQRGAGHSRPRLDCTQRAILPEGALSRDIYVAAIRQAAALCRDDWRNAGVDLEAYNTIENAADVDALRAALGYPKINIIALSYGTHLSAAFIRHYPQSLNRVLLYGIEGPDHTYDLPSQVLLSLSKIATAAEQAENLRSKIPPGGLIAALRTLEERLARSPVTVTVQFAGQPRKVTIGKFELQRMVKNGADELSQLTWASRIIDMFHGDFSRAAPSVLEMREGAVNSAMLSMMDCASGLSKERRERLQNLPEEHRAQEVLGDLNLYYFGTCDIWGNPDLGAGFRSDLQSDTPLLIFQGTWDISTPYINAVELTRGLSNGHLVTVTGGTHFALYDLFAHWAPIKTLVRDYFSGQPISPPAIIELPPATFR